MVRFRAAVADRAHWFVYTKVESKGLAPHRNNQRLYQGDLKKFLYLLCQTCRGLKRIANVRFCNCRLYMRLEALSVAQRTEPTSIAGGFHFRVFYTSRMYRFCRGQKRGACTAGR